MIAAAAAGPSAFWYLTRGTGIIALVLLTLSVALGVANVRRVSTPELPRFVLDAVHRNVSLLAVAFLLVHIVTSLLDGFAPISLLDTVIPFRAAYRPLWLGFGALASDLLIAIALTSLIRRRLGYGAWRAVHWLAYASWPVALLHGLGTGSDVKTGWSLVITGGCVIVVIVAVVARATAGWPQHRGARSIALAASAVVPIGLLAWLPSGPLAAGWAKKAGTPAKLLVATSGASSAAGASGGSGGSGGQTPRGGGTSGGSGRSTSSSTSFNASVSGTVHQGQQPGGLEEVDITLSVHGQKLSSLDIRLFGQPLGGGGVQMSSSDVTLGPGSNPSEYRGRITGLNGTNIAARVRSSGGKSIALLAQLQIDPGSGNVSGTVSAGAARGEGEGSR